MTVVYDAKLNFRNWNLYPKVENTILKRPFFEEDFHQSVLSGR